jgi:hypothetical protein
MPIKTGYKQGTPCWVDLATTDQAAAKEFYGSLLGWSWDDMPMGEGLTYSMAKLNGRQAAAVYAEQDDEKAQGIPPHWSTYIAVQNVDEAVSKVVPAGGQVLMGPMDVFESGRMAVVTDPSGAAVGLWQAKDHIGFEIVNEPGAITWNELISDGVQRAGAFFTQVLGVETVKQEGPVPYTTINVDGKAVGGMLDKTPDMGPMPNVWAIYIAVDDCDSIAKKAESLGGKVLVQPMDIPVGRFATLQDPQGAVFSVMKLTQEIM